MPTSSSPPGLLDHIGAEFGPRPRTDEIHVRLPTKRLLEIGNQEKYIIDQMVEITNGLMNREPWDLALVCLASTHRAGHKLWDDTGAVDSAGPSGHPEVRAALRDVYVAVDEAVGRLVEAAGDVDVAIVFSVHGMGANLSRTEILPKMLALVLGARDADPIGPGQALGRIRRLVPGTWRQMVKSRMPMSMQDRLTVFWRFQGTDWARTPAFCLVADLQGYVRVNLRGRESRGIVQPGPEYEELCDRIAHGLGTFVDADTGEPVVARIARSSELYDDGARRDRLPDLLVNWSSTPAAKHREIVSPDHGSIPWPTPGTHPSGRSGNHRGEGFVIAVGQEFRPGSRIVDAHVLDLAPTVFNLFDVPTPPRMSGRVLRSTGT
jgi:predicted AlkP superfamily phosphohydrolase/phosphomutase